VRCDLHIHSVHSGMCTLPVLKRLCRESYSAPEAVYDTLRRRGMDLVTLTDHDSIDGAEVLWSKSNFFISEEVTCQSPSGTELHVGVYGIGERQHQELQRRRNDLPRLAAYLGEQRLFAVVNHPFSALTGRRAAEDYDWFSSFPAVEIINAHLADANNRHAGRFAEYNFQVGVGGSDAHTLASAGTAWTEVPGARNPQEFLAGLWRGRGRVGGSSGTYAKLTGDVFRIALAMMNDNPAYYGLAPLLVAAPLFTLANTLLERVFAQKWGRAILEAPADGPAFGGSVPSQEFVV
jgi:predicted metal-dependent phosphoesterase TrpH